MNELIDSSVQQTMTSREIAELTGKRHSDVLRDIDRLVESLNADFNKSLKSSTYKDVTGKNNRMILMSRPAAMRLICQYSEEAMVAILKRIDATMIEEIISGFDAQDVPADRFVYVAVERHSGRYKVGISKDPVARVAQIGRSHPEGLRLVAVYEAVDGFLSERNAHAVLKDYRLNGEWFAATAPVAMIAGALQ